MKPRLALIRIPITQATHIASAPGIREHFEILHLVVGSYEENTAKFEMTVGQRGVHERFRGEVKNDLFDILKREGVTHAVLCQPLLWYTDMAAEVCKELGIKFLFYEAFPGNYHIFDTIGCQYCHDNEIVRYEKKVRVMDPCIPFGTRFPQPSPLGVQDLHRRYAPPQNTIVVFGQVEHDMSLKDTTGRTKYEDWMFFLVRENPQVTFLLKDHPLITKSGSRSSVIERLLNSFTHTRFFEESIFSAFRAYWAFAAYSSTTILEGAYRGIPFITGGYHFLDDPGLSFRVNASEGFKRILNRYQSFRLDPDALHRRLGFLTGIYALKTTDPRLLDKILLSADEFYGRHGGS